MTTLFSYAMYPVAWRYRSFFLPFFRHGLLNSTYPTPNSMEPRPPRNRSAVRSLIEGSFGVAGSGVLDSPGGVWTVPWKTSS